VAFLYSRFPAPLAKRILFLIILSPGGEDFIFDSLSLGERMKVREKIPEKI
jgi:hypothetical protein